MPNCSKRVIQALIVSRSTPKIVVQLGDREAFAIQQDGVCALAEGKARVVTVEVFQPLSDLARQVSGPFSGGAWVEKGGWS
jgi:hypothetical protein